MTIYVCCFFVMLSPCCDWWPASFSLSYTYFCSLSETQQLNTYLNVYILYCHMSTVHTLRQWNLWTCNRLLSRKSVAYQTRALDEEAFKGTCYENDHRLIIFRQSDEEKCICSLFVFINPQYRFVCYSWRSRYSCEGSSTDVELSFTQTLPFYFRHERDTLIEVTTSKQGAA